MEKTHNCALLAHAKTGKSKLDRLAVRRSGEMTTLGALCSELLLKWKMRSGLPAIFD
jgi:hypothetical protein